MSRDAQRWGALVLAIIGVAIGELLSYPAGIAITFVGVFFGFNSIRLLNIVASRFVMITTAALHGLVIWRASGHPLLGAAPPLAAIVMLPYEFTGRRLGYQNGWLVPMGPAVEIICAVLTRPYSLWHLALVPTLLGCSLFAVSIVRGMFDINPRARAINLKIGEPFPEFVLRARLNQPEFRLADHRGQHVLVCLLRGDWCPVCHVMMRIIAKDAPILASHGVKVVAVSAAEGAAADDFARDLGLDYTILFDPKCTVAASVGAVHENEPEPGKNTNLPSMFLVDKEGLLAYVSTVTDLTLHDPRRVIHLLSKKEGAAVAAATT